MSPFLAKVENILKDLAIMTTVDLVASIILSFIPTLTLFTHSNTV